MPPSARLAFVLSFVLSACAAGLTADDLARQTAQERRSRDDARYVDSANRVAVDPGFVFEYGSCIRYTFDSAQNLLVRDQGFSVDPDQPRDVVENVDSVHVALTLAEVEAVFAEADRIGLWTFPAEFAGALVVDSARVAAGESGGTVVPNGKYRIDLRRGGQTAIVRWSDGDFGPLTPAAERLFAFGAGLDRTLWSKVEAQGAFAGPSVICL